MLHYKTKNVNGKRVREPQWRKEHFTRCRGIVDAVLAKNRFVTAERMEGGYFEKRQRELMVFEAAVEAYLLETAGDKLQDYREVCAMGSEELPKASAGAMPSGLTTGQMRRFRQQAAQALAQRDKIAEARAKRARQAAELQAMAQAAEQQVMSAQAETNLELALYAKASRFRVVEREIPTVKCTFSAEKFLKQYDIETK